MMDDIHGSIYWCILQVTLVVGIGVSASLVFARRYPAAACSMTYATVVIAALLTVLAPLPVHRYFVLATSRLEAQPEIDPVTQRPTVDAALPANVGPLDYSASLKLNGDSLFAALRTVASTINPGRQPGHQTMIRFATWCWFAAIALGLLRLVTGLAFVMRMRYEGQPVTDPELLQLVKDIASRLDCSQVPTIRVGKRLKSAAVAGWLRPVLIMPPDWCDWNDDERRAVVSHEVAHIVRHDSLWRTAAASVLAMHFGNPLVHWLMRRVTLYQELSADLLAVNIVGSRAYLHSLSSLAIRHDNQIRSSVRPDVMPVFSGELMRRITMLRSMDGTEGMSNRSRRSRFMITAITVVMFAIGLATVATRGFAEPPADEPSPKPGTVKSVSNVKVIAGEDSSVDPIAGLFRHPQIDPSVVGPNDRGMVAIRVGELLARPELKALIPVLNASATEWLKTELKWETAPEIHLESIEWIAGQLYVSLAPIKNGTKDEHGRISFGSSGAVVKLLQKVDLKNSVLVFAPNSKRHVVEGRDVFELPVIPMLGPVPVWIGTRDESTLLINFCQKEITPQTTLAEIFSPPLVIHLDSSTTPTPDVAEVKKPKRDSSRWASTWKRIDGGLVSIAFTDAEIHDVGNFPDPETDFEKGAIPLVKALVPRCRTVACGFDITPGKQQVGVRVRLTHSSHESAKQSKDDLQTLVVMATTEIAKRVSALDTTSQDNEWNAAMIASDQILKVAAVEVQDLKDGTADVIITFLIPLESAVKLVPFL